MGKIIIPKCLTILKNDLTTSKALRHDDDVYETPKWMFDGIQEKTGLKFQLDVCASKENALCIDYLTEEQDALNYELGISPMFCNPPRSKNGKFVNKIYDTWEEKKCDIVMLLCWNDLGNKYGQKLLPCILDGSIQVVENYGKVKFYKQGKESKYVSRLTYFSAWFKSEP